MSKSKISFGIGHPCKEFSKFKKNNKKILRRIGLNYLEERLSGNQLI